MVFDNLSKQVLGCALEVHKTLGPGLLESAYESALAYELSTTGLKFQRLVDVPVVYKEVKLDCGYRIDLLVEGSVVVEIKSVDPVAPIHEAQVITYLKLSGCKIALLINFNVGVLKDGIRRFVNGEF